MRDIITEIWQTARRNKLRTTLTGFAVAWGIFMIIVLFYGGRTSKAYQGLSEGRYINLNTRDLETTESEFKNTIDAVGAVYYHSATVTNGEQYMNLQIIGIHPIHSSIVKRDLVCGRFINEIDLKEKRKVLVLTNKQAKELEPKDFKKLIGKHVKVGNISFKVVGIYKEPGDGESSAYSPYSTIKSIYGAKDNSLGHIEFTFHGLNSEQANEAFENKYRRRLNANHQAHPEDERAIWIWNGYTASMQMEQGIAIIRTALWIVGLFTLLSGIVGVSNIMLITVKERTHEFGTESVIITTFFGYVGMVLGVAANEYMDATIGHETIDTGLFQATMFLNPTVGLDVCFEATMVMVIAGTIAGLIPAFKASRIRPIEALRAD